MNRSDTTPPPWAALPGLPHDDARPVFAEPWQAQAFALVLQLHARGAFTWDHWTRTLSAQLRARSDENENGSRYYECWLSALEQIVNELGLIDLPTLAARKDAWAEAYRRTPHGTPVLAPKQSSSS